MARSVALRLLLAAAAVAAASAQSYGKSMKNGGPVCKDGVWMEADLQRLMRNEINPEVQCFRKPPCIRWSYLSTENCAFMKNDEDFPTWDPYLNTTADMPTMRSVVEDFLVNKTVFFVGDSINGLVYQAALCEMSRWGLSISAHHPHDSGEGMSPELLARVRAYYRRVARYHHLDDATGKGLWLGGEPPKPEVVRSTGTLVVPKGWHKYKASDMAAVLSLADVVIVNYALHYHGPQDHPERTLDEYEQEMHAMFLQLDAFAKLPGKAAIFRETGAQHFPGTGSYAGDEQAHPTVAKGCHCAAMSEEVLKHNEVTRFNDVVHSLAKRHPHVRVLPFYDVTAPRHDMHEGAYCAFDQARDEPNADYLCCDCTHFCHTPQLWRHVFAALYDVLETTRVRDTPTRDFDLP